jgi:hypothetical protein
LPAGNCCIKEPGTSKPSFPSYAVPLWGMLIFFGFQCSPMSAHHSVRFCSACVRFSRSAGSTHTVTSALDQDRLFRLFPVACAEDCFFHSLGDNGGKQRAYSPSL